MKTNISQIDPKLRVHACVAACSGVPTAALTPGLLAEALEALQDLVDVHGLGVSAQWDKARAVLARQKGQPCT